MLIDRYVFREIALPSGLGLLVYSSIFVVHYFFQLAEQWVAGALTTGDLFWEIVYLLPSTLAQTIPMSVLLGILIGFSRLSADSEITAMRSTGISYYHLLLPTAALAVIAWAATSAVYIEAVPWANTAFVNLGRVAASRADINREIHPGSWVHLVENVPGQDAAVFARGVDDSVPSRPWLTEVDIYLLDRPQGKAEYHHATRARITRVVADEDSARLRFDLEEVRSVYWKPNDPSQKPTLQTAPTAWRLGPARPLPGIRAFATQQRMDKDARQQSIGELRTTLTELDRMARADELDKTDPKAAAALRAQSHVSGPPNARQRTRRLTELEIHKKFAIPVACLVFAATAMPLGIATRRGGRPASFAISIGVIALWWLVWSPSEQWVMAGKLSAPLGAWLPNIVLAIVAVNLLVGQRRQQRVGWYRALRDAQLLGATVFLVLGGILLYERAAMPPPPEGLSAFPLWVPLAGLALLAGHVAFVLFRDPIARALAAATDAVRRPRRLSVAEVERIHDEPFRAPEPARAPAADARGRRAWLEGMRNVVAFALLALLAVTVLQVLGGEHGLRQGLLEALTAWQGAALLLLLAACGALQVAGVRVVKTLDWWVLTAYAKALALVLGSVCFIYAIFEYINLAVPIFQNHVTPGRVVDYYLHVTPKMLFQVVPISAMVAALVVFGVMTKFNETTALRCGGVSAYRLVAPVVLVALALSGGAFVLHDYVLPKSNAEAENIRREIEGSAPVRRETSRGFAMGEGGTAIYRYDRVDAPDPTGGVAGALIHNLTVLRHDGHGRIRTLYNAREAAWDGTTWILRSGWQGSVTADNDVELSRFESLPVPGMERPDYFAATRRDPDQMTFKELRRHVEEQEAAGFATGRLRVELHGKLALPCASLVLVLVGLPFAFTSGRRGALYGVGLSVILFVLYYIALAFFTALGSAGYLPPVAAAWAPNVLFALAGLYMMLHLRT